MERNTLSEKPNKMATTKGAITKAKSTLFNVGVEKVTYEFFLM